MKPIKVTKKTHNQIECDITIELGEQQYPYPKRYYEIYLEPTSKGMKHPNYKKIKHELGDDWSTNITDTWFIPNVLTKIQYDKVYAIVKAIENEGRVPR